MIGWRGWEPSTPEHALATQMGGAIVRQGDDIITGNAPGFDQAVATGGNAISPGNVHLHLPWPLFERHAIQSGNKVYPELSAEFMYQTVLDLYDTYRKREGAYRNLTASTQRLMARNVSIIHQAERVIAAPNFVNGKPFGGTAFGIWLAEFYKKRLFIVDFTQPPGPVWDRCIRCGFQSALFDCGAPLHSLKAYCSA